MTIGMGVLNARANAKYSINSLKIYQDGFIQVQGIFHVIVKRLAPDLSV
jgi:hypothetical protein